MIQDIDHWKQTIESLVAEKDYHRSLYTQTIVTSFSSTADVIDVYLDIYFNQYLPLNRTGFHMLQILISAGGSMIQTELSKRVYRSRYTITKTVDMLEKNGWVERQSVEGDRRVNNVTITTKGLELIKNSMDGMLQMSQLAVSCLDEKERKELRLINKKLREHVSNLIDNTRRKNQL
ncbi:MAG: MarR family transcriptional regulator [Desulfobacteraceae bacterium]|nr:MarR family transcriptional regulator [Desulfobacteraceae bacterium]